MNASTRAAFVIKGETSSLWAGSCGSLLICELSRMCKLNHNSLKSWTNDERREGNEFPWKLLLFKEVNLSIQKNICLHWRGTHSAFNGNRRHRLFDISPNPAHSQRRGCEGIFISFLFSKDESAFTRSFLKFHISRV